MSHVNWYEEVLNRKENLLQSLSHFLSIESVLDESNATLTAPFGKKIDEALRYILDLGTQDGFLAKNLDGYAGHLEYGKGDEIIGVLCHVDVVPASDGWVSPPFTPDFREGKIYARGAIDDKGPTIAAYYALKIIKDLKLPLTKRVRLILGTDEESQWRCMNYYFEHEDMPTMGFTPDADFPIIIAEKGLLDIRCAGVFYEEEVISGDWTLLEFKSGQRTNMVPDLAVAKLAGNGDAFALKEQIQSYLLEHQIQGYAEESNDFIQVVVKGKAHHGSEPDKGSNAGLNLARVLSNISLNQRGTTFVKMINQYLVNSFFGEKLGIDQSDDVVGRLTLNAGVFHYEHNNNQFVQLNIRYPISGNKDQIVNDVEKKLAQFGLSVTDVDHKASHFCEPKHPLVTTLSKVYEEQTGEKAELLSIGGGTYARVLDTGVAFGPLFPGREETAHQKDEHIHLDDMLRATAIYAQAIYELAK